MLWVLSSQKISFINKSVIVDDSKPVNLKKKAHGCFMIIAWVLFASTGIILARYYKFIFKEQKLFNSKFWFTLHYVLMILATMITLISFLIILSDLNWKWKSDKKSLEFAHSIFGIIAITFSIIQVLALV